MRNLISRTGGENELAVGIERETVDFGGVRLDNMRRLLVRVITRVPAAKTDLEDTIRNITGGVGKNKKNVTK